MNLLSQAAERIARTAPRTVEARALLERLERLNARQGFTLSHALSVAAERFDHDAATMLQQKAASEIALQEKPGARLMFHPNACVQLEQQFRQQAADVRELIAALEGDDEEEELEANARP